MRNQLHRCLLIAAIPLLVIWAAPLRAGDTLHFAADRPIDINHIKLDLRVDLKKKTVASHATIDLTPLREVKSIRFDAVGFDVKNVQLGAADSAPVKCDFENDGDHITLLPAHPIAEGQKAQAYIEYQLTDPAAGLSFFGPSADEPEAPLCMWSQGESITNRYWVPCFDHPNEKQTTEIIATVDSPNIAVSNGKLVKETDNRDGTRTFHWLQDKPHAAYLMTLVVGEFISKTDTWRGKPVTYYVREKFKDEIANSFANTTKMLDFFSDKIGVEYPWDKYAQICTYNFGGGMENTSSTTLTEYTLHDKRAHLDSSSDGLVSHELAHQWWGDLLTCKDWAHIWLNEGFASYFEALWDEKNEGPDEFAVNMSRKAEAALSGGKEKPIVYRGYEDPDEQFDSRAYPKGAWVLHMLRREVGDDLFWKIMKTYCTRYSLQCVETSDLRRTAEEVTGRSFEKFFYQWTECPGAPEVTAAYEWQPDDKLASVKVTQKQTNAFSFPLKIEFRFDEGTPPYALTRDISEKETRILVPLDKRPRLVRIDPDQAVLMDLAVEQSRDLWLAQLANDPNPVARSAAAKHLGDSGKSNDIESLAGQLTKEPFWSVQAAIAKALAQSTTDGARDALLAGLKIENPKARAAVVESLADFRDEPAVAEALKAIVEKGDPSYKVEAAAIASYASVCKDPPMDLLKSLLKRDSDNEVIRSAALKAIGKRCEEKGLGTLIDWTKPDKAGPCRIAAIDAMADAAKNSDLSGPDKKRCVEAIAQCLKIRSRRLQGAALGALGDIGSAARSALPEIDRIARVGLPRIRANAKKTAETIRSASTATASADGGERRGRRGGRGGGGGGGEAGPGEMREKVSKLEKRNEELQKRIEKLEATSKPKKHDDASPGS